MVRPALDPTLPPPANSWVLKAGRPRDPQAHLLVSSLALRYAYEHARQSANQMMESLGWLPVCGWWQDCAVLQVGSLAGVGLIGGIIAFVIWSRKKHEAATEMGGGDLQKAGPIISDDGDAPEWQ